MLLLLLFKHDEEYLMLVNVYLSYIKIFFFSNIQELQEKLNVIL